MFALPLPEDTVMHGFESSLNYEHYSIGQSIIAVQKLLEGATDRSKAQEFYTAIEQCMIALEASMAENLRMRKSYENMVNRMIVMEKLMALLVK